MVRAGIVEDVRVEPICGIHQLRALLIAGQIETFKLKGWLQILAIRPLITDMRATEPDPATIGPPLRIDSQRASRGLEEKGGARLTDAGAAATASAAENADVGTTAGHRQDRGLLGVHRIGLCGRHCRYDPLRGSAPGWTSCRRNLTSLFHGCSMPLLFRPLQFSAQFGNGLLLRFQHAKQFGIGWNALGMRGAGRHQAQTRSHDEKPVCRSC